MSLFFRNQFVSWEIGIATKYVRKFKRSGPWLDREDEDGLVDECLALWREVRGSVEQGKAIEAYMASIIANKLRDMVRDRKVAKREGYFKAFSLDQLIEDSGDVFSGQDQQTELRAKLDEVMAKLTPQQRAVVAELGQTPITRISVTLNIHRSTVYEEIRRIREIFQREGLGDFL